MYGLKDGLLQQIVDAADRCGIQELFLFGSRARGDQAERSDIDLAARFKNSRQRMDFVDELEEIRTLLMFDVVDLSSVVIDPELYLNVMREGIKIYEKV